MALRNALSALVIVGLCAPPFAADRLFVAGPDGVVLKAEAPQGEFEYFGCQCAAPIVSLAADRRLYALDESSQLLVFDLATGVLENLFALPLSGTTAVAAEGAALFVGTDAGLVVRVDSSTGAILDSRSIPSGVRTLLAHRGFLLAAGSDGGIYRAPTNGGEFTYFTCFCFSSIESMAVDGDELVVGDEFGIVARIDFATGNILTAFFASPMNVLTVDSGELLVHSGSGMILRLDGQTGVLADPKSYYLSPLEVSAMILVDDPAPKSRQPTPAQPMTPKLGLP